MTIFTSPHGSLPLPADRTILDDFERNAREIPDKPYLICGTTDRIITYKQAHDMVRKVAAGLYADGVRSGDVVVVLSINCVEYPLVFFALNYLQATYSPSFPQYTPRETARLLLSTKAKRLVAHSSLLELALSSSKLAGFESNQLLAIGDLRPDLPVRNLQDYLDSPRAFPAIPRLNPNAIVALPFSSGTGSRPKGVLLSARALYAAASQTASIEERHPVVLGLLPFYHISPLTLLHITVQLGLAMLVLPTFEAESFLRAITKYKVEKLSGMPLMVDFLAFHPLVAKFDLSCVKYIVTAGVPQSREIAIKAYERTGIEVQQGYGMTEFAGALTTMPNGKVKLGSVGMLLPNVEMKVKALDSDEELGVNRRGELLFRSPQLMAGYLNDAKATKAALTPDGFLKTGDLGYIDEDGYVFLVDRIKSLIKYNGYHVSASELEDLLVHHPLISEAIVVRGVDAKGDEIPKAYVVPTPNAPKRLTRQEVMLYIASKVAPFKRIREVEFVASIPKNPAGKMHRQKMQARANASRNASTPPPTLSRI